MGVAIKLKERHKCGYGDLNSGGSTTYVTNSWEKRICSEMAEMINMGGHVGHIVNTLICFYSGCRCS